MKKSTILALSLVLIGVAVSVVVLGPRLGLTIIGSNSTGTTTSNTSIYTTTVTSTATTVSSGNALYSWFTNRSKAVDIFNGLIDAFRGFLSSITSRIKESSTRLDIVINAAVYAAIFFLLGKLAAYLVNIFKWFMYILAMFCIAVAILVMLGVV